jgi:F420-dependent oxidoreductase-like protein
MDIGLMVEGQNGLTWERWSHILALAEELKFPSVFRSDHYFIGTHKQSLEAYLSFVVAAQETSTIRFGPLVTPLTFRSPVDIGRMAAQIDEFSGGRFVMGLGAGWHEPEHLAYGIRFPPIRERFDRLDEGINVIQALWSEGPASYKGKYYEVRDVDCLPKPTPGGAPILIGGAGEKRTLALVAKYATEWNCVNLGPEAYAHKKEVLERHCEAIGRDPATIKRSMMVFGLMGPNKQTLHDVTQRFKDSNPANQSTSIEEFTARSRDRGMIVGQTEEVVDRLGQLAELGLEEVEFEHLNYDSDEGPRYLASDIAPKVAGL